MTIAVGLGLMDYPFASPVAYWDWIQMCEDSDLDSLWQTDRLVSEEPFLECISTMAALAGATKRIKFGMNVVSLGLRDPLLLAKQCATIDYLSEGRLLPGFGIGNARAADWKATGTPTKGRGSKTNEALQLISQLWCQNRVTFKGKHFSYKNATISPKPIQKSLPMWVGGASQHAIERTARFGTGWQAGLETPKEVSLIIKNIKRSLPKYNRTIAVDHYGAAFSFRFGDWNDKAVKERALFFRNKLSKKPEDLLVVGGSDEILGRIKEFINSGTSKFILNPMGNTDLEIYVQTKKLIDTVLPEIKALN